MLKSAAAMAGISTNYTDIWGNENLISDETLQKLLTVLGYQVDTSAQLLESAQRIHQKKTLKSVYVFTEDEPINIEVYLPKHLSASDIYWRLRCENGAFYQGKVSLPTEDKDSALQTMPFDGEEKSSSVGKRIDVGKIYIETRLDHGYHQLELFDLDLSSKEQNKLVTEGHQECLVKSLVVICPAQCYQPEALTRGKKLWGVNCQLYTFRSEQNFGVGDFGDLRRLIPYLAEKGCDFIGLNPLHALFPVLPEAASPYSPSSRRWLNSIYIEVLATPESINNAKLDALLSSADHQAEIDTIKASSFVDYSAVYRVKTACYQALYRQFKQQELANDTKRAKRFKRFVKEGGQHLHNQCVFDALHQSLIKTDESIWGWPAFPKELQNPNSEAVKSFVGSHADEIQYFIYLQWVMDEQLEQLQWLAKSLGMSIGLYRDLAVGVTQGGAESWTDDGTLVKRVSIGAPPDPLGPLGQNWGLMPMCPNQMRTQAYRPFIELLRANMKYSGALRIDHILGFMRMWWIPEGMEGALGAYVDYPLEDLLRIMALESHRHQTLIIGEDLGTVPPELTSLMHSVGILSYKVFFFETSSEDGGYISPHHYANQSMAVLSTHDLPTLKGFWECMDLKMGEDIGLYQNKDKVAEMYQGRLMQKQRILDSVVYHDNLLPSVVTDANSAPMDPELSLSLHRHLAQGNSKLFAVQLEDLTQVDTPVNIPGTTTEYPNWRRKLTFTLEDLLSDQGVATAITEINSLRSGIVE